MRYILSISVVKSKIPFFYFLIMCGIFIICHIDIHEQSNDLPEKWVGFVGSGQLGNQLWELASIHGIAKQRKAKWCAIEDSGDLLKQYMTYIEWTVQPPEVCPGILWINRFFWYTPSLTTIQDDGKFATYNTKFLQAVSPRLRIDSNLQSYKYFDKTTPIPFRLKAIRRAQTWVKKKNITVAIHVRRGDKMNDGLNVVPPLIYFKLAVAELQRLFPHESRVYVVVTDDTDWVNQHSFFREMYVLNSERPDYDMAVISACHHKIISIGTFGWWGAFFSDPGHNKTSAVIYPTLQYEGPKSHGFKHEDYFPFHWTGIQYPS